MPNPYKKHQSEIDTLQAEIAEIREAEELIRRSGGAVIWPGEAGESGEDEPDQDEAPDFEHNEIVEYEGEQYFFDRHYADGSVELRLKWCAGYHHVDALDVHRITRIQHQEDRPESNESTNKPSGPSESQFKVGDRVLVRMRTAGKVPGVIIYAPHQRGYSYSVKLDDGGVVFPYSTMLTALAPES